VDPFGFQCGNPNEPWLPCNQSQAYGSGGFSFADGFNFAEQMLGGISNSLAAGFNHLRGIGQLAAGAIGIANSEDCGPAAPACFTAAGAEAWAGVNNLVGNPQPSEEFDLFSNPGSVFGYAASGNEIGASAGAAAWEATALYTDIASGNALGTAGDAIDLMLHLSALASSANGTY
jgi:hypothetical protein